MANSLVGNDLLRRVSPAGGGSVQLPMSGPVDAGRVMADSPQIAKRSRPPRLPICGKPQIRTVIRSPVWAVSGDLLLVAVVRVDRSSDRDAQDVAGTRNFTATLNAYFPGLSSRLGARQRCADSRSATCSRVAITCPVGSLLCQV